MNRFFIVMLVVGFTHVVAAKAFAQDACMEFAVDVCLSCSVDSEACQAASRLPVAIAMLSRLGKKDAADEAISGCKSMKVLSRMMRDADNPAVLCAMIADSVPKTKSKESKESKEEKIIF